MSESSREYRVLRSYLEKKLSKLAHHEKKDISTIALPQKNFHPFTINTKDFFSIETNEYNQIIDKKLLDIKSKSIELFGTGNAYDIIKAFHLNENFLDLDFEKYYLQTEQFSLIINRNENYIPSKILRIDLFRGLNVNKTSNKKYDFTGGLLHTLKHFCKDHTPLSTGNERREIDYISDIILMATVALFNYDLIAAKEKNKFTCMFEYKNYGKFKASFYFEKNSEIYFLNTIFPI